MVRGKFYKPVSPKEKIKNFFLSLLFWKGRKKGMIHTMDIKWSHIRIIFYPKHFHEKYGYLGSVPYHPETDYFKAIYPLIILMDHEAKPKWCPRWFLRFLHLFGNDNSIVRVRNFTLNKLFSRLTKGISMWDYKTKWHDYDLRISVTGNQMIQDLADDIESCFYRKGRRKELLESLKSFASAEGRFNQWSSLCELEALVRTIIEEQTEN
jgi:hypothetical protein